MTEIMREVDRAATSNTSPVIGRRASRVPCGQGVHPLRVPTDCDYYDPAQSSGLPSDAENFDRFRSRNAPLDVPNPDGPEGLVRPGITGGLSVRERRLPGIPPAELGRVATGIVNDSVERSPRTSDS
jgi:hypothetical protein